MSQTKHTRKLPLFICSKPDNPVTFEQNYGLPMFIPGVLYRQDMESAVEGLDACQSLFDQPGWGDFHEPDTATFVPVNSVDDIDRVIDEWAASAKEKAHEIWAKRNA